MYRTHTVKSHNRYIFPKERVFSVNNFYIQKLRRQNEKKNKLKIRRCWVVCLVGELIFWWDLCCCVCVPHLHYILYSMYNFGRKKIYVLFLGGRVVRCRYRKLEKNLYTWTVESEKGACFLPLLFRVCFSVLLCVQHNIIIHPRKNHR